MLRPRQRACLEAGLNLDINKLTRQGLFRPRGKVGPYTINWTNSYTGDVIAGGQITAYLESDYAGWFRIQIGELDQWIDLMAQPLWWTPMVLQISYYSSLLCPVDASRREAFLRTP